MLSSPQRDPNAANEVPSASRSKYSMARNTLPENVNNSQRNNVRNTAREVEILNSKSSSYMTYNQMQGSQRYSNLLKAKKKPEQRDSSWDSRAIENEEGAKS
jgi:glycyl-tRNA synthetase beta subunit